jgi:DNA-binding response OmpR family regulator
MHMAEQRVLIVDDEQRTLMFLRESLIVSGLQAELTCVPSAEQALSAFEQHAFDAAILDIRMAGMDGLQLLEQLKARWPAVRVIIVSAYHDASIEGRARDLGVYQFLHKPFAFDEFIGTVASALREAAQDSRAQRVHKHEVWDMQFVQRQLTALMRDTGAQSVLLTNGGGAVLAQVGAGNGFGDALPAPAANAQAEFSFAYHEGKTHTIYAAEVANGLRLSLIFDKSQPGSRIGTVLQYTRRTVQELAAALNQPDMPPQTAA